jgi:hypothetical protein
MFIATTCRPPIFLFVFRRRETSETVKLPFGLDPPDVSKTPSPRRAEKQKESRD